jgi:pimeloyl-ACP methyl ester carboxylesterase
VVPAAALAGCLVAALACAPAAAASQLIPAPITTVAPGTSGGLAPRGDVPALRWHACPAPEAPTLQCSTLRVPYDYARATGRWFSLAVSRVPATGRRTGTMFFDPGGPGGSGASITGLVAGLLPPSVRSAFDVVGWDPRGIGATKPALQSCLLPRLVLPVSGPVDWTKVRARSTAAVAAANRACQRRNAGFVGSMGTVNAARDLDRLRAAVGDQKLTYWAMSYGTRIGYVYAILFPQRVRAMVLDGNLDPRGTYAGLARGGVALDSALAFLRSVSPPTYASVRSTIAGLDAAPVVLGGGLRYTRWNYLTEVSGYLPSQRAWRFIVPLDEGVETARRATPEGAAARARLREALATTDGNLGGAFSVVNCLDYADRMAPAAIDAAIARHAAIAPVFGGLLTAEYLMGCTGLTMPPDPVPTTRSAANRARVARLPVVIVNATNDASTPMVWAQQMRRSFPAGVLIRYRSGQHVLWVLARSSCIDDRITPYVVSLRRPTAATCPFVRPPGLPAAAGTGSASAPPWSASWTPPGLSPLARLG